MELTLGEVKPIINYIIENNKVLQKNGQFPVTINIEGHAGIGKTAVLEEIANELGANFIKLNLAQLTESSDLIGWPLKEHYVCKPDGECKWISSELIEAYAKAGWELTEHTRMSYAVPQWIKGIDESKPTILLLDDASRATPQILQAVMEITARQEFISWKLPPNSHIVLSTNPDNGDYAVSSYDEAQATRFVTFKVKFDKSDWAKWAEAQGIDGRAINFLLSYGSELMNREGSKEAKVNARNYTMFANIISGLDDWSKPEQLATILQIASGCFLDDDNIVGSLFTTFIANKLVKLMDPESMLTKDWSYVKGELTKQIYDGEFYRADIAATLATRFLNFSILYLSKKGNKMDIVVDRILKFIDNEKTLLTEDLIFTLVKTLNKKYPTRCNKLLLNPKIVTKLM